MVTETDALQGCSSPRGGAAAALYAGHSHDATGEAVCTTKQHSRSWVGRVYLKGLGSKLRKP